MGRIVGGYNLGREHWQRCGLCNKEHGKGYVVATTEGLETQIGKDCGQRHLGAKFEELERLFTAALDAQDRMGRLLSLLAQRPQLQARAERAITQCDRAYARIAAIKHKIEREPTLSAAFRESIVVDVRATDDEFAMTNRRYRQVLVGRIDGYAAVSTRSPKTEIRDSVMTLIASLTQEALSGLSGKRLAEKSLEANRATDLLVEADAYVALAARFVDRRNWLAFASAFGPDGLKTNSRGRRILQQLVDQGTEPIPE